MSLRAAMTAIASKPCARRVSVLCRAGSGRRVQLVPAFWVAQPLPSRWFAGKALIALQQAVSANGFGLSKIASWKPLGERRAPHDRDATSACLEFLAL